jgi:ubiquinone/menaquinone biosynthesis C-methylase UbiE
MLERLRRKIAAEPNLAAAELIEADVRELELPRQFGCIFIGFQAISELAEVEDLRRALARIAALLEPGGTVLISMHEPIVRGPQCEGSWRSLGIYTLPASESSDGAQVEVCGRWLLLDDEPEDGLVSGEQAYFERDALGQFVGRVEMPVRFRLYSAATLKQEAAAHGLTLRTSLDGYSLPPRPAGASSRMRVLVFERAAT